jgi:hypothetical protein
VVVAAVELNTVVVEPGALAVGKSEEVAQAVEAAVVPVAVVGSLTLTDLVVTGLVSRQQVA